MLAALVRAACSRRKPASFREGPNFPVILTRSTDWVEQSHSGPQTFASEADGPAEPLDTALFTSRPGLENPAEITLVTVEFLARGDESELVITHERFTKAE